MIGERAVRVVLQDSAKIEFEELNKIAGEQISKGKTNSEELQLLKSIKNKIELIKQNPMCGDPIAKRLIPVEYNVTNLWRIELAHFWRMLYTVRGDQIEVICFILDILDHGHYDKKFGYE